MIGIFLESLFSGRIFFLAIFSVVAGFFLGASGVRTSTYVFWIPALMVIQAILFASSQYVDFLLSVAQTGSAGFNVNTILLWHTILHPALLFMFLIFGRKTKAAMDQEVRQKANAIDGPGMVNLINTFAAHPQLASGGWFEQRWLPMSSDERHTWVESHLQELRDLWAFGQDGGFEARGLELPMLLATIDYGSVQR